MFRRCYIIDSPTSIEFMNLLQCILKQRKVLNIKEIDVLKYLVAYVMSKLCLCQIFNQKKLWVEKANGFFGSVNY